MTLRAAGGPPTATIATTWLRETTEITQDSLSEKMDPAKYHAADSLRDGAKIVIRAIRPDDRIHLREEFSELSTESVRFRFHGLRKAPGEIEATALATVDFVDHVALVATLDNNLDHLIGGIRYIISENSRDHRRAELAFLVLDEYQGKGLGSLLLNHIAAIARARGLDEFEADVLADNHHMLRVFEHCGFPCVAHPSGAGEVRVTISIGAR